MSRNPRTSIGTINYISNKLIIIGSISNYVYARRSVINSTTEEPLSVHWSASLRSTAVHGDTTRVLCHQCKSELASMHRYTWHQVRGFALCPCDRSIYSHRSQKRQPYRYNRDVIFYKMMLTIRKNALIFETRWRERIKNGGWATLSVSHHARQRYEVLRTASPIKAKP